MDARSSFTRAMAAALLALAGCAGTTQAPNTKSDPGRDDVENAALYELNRVREDAGIATPMILCTALDASSSAHSDDMRDKDYLSDVAPDGSTVRSRTCSAGYQPGCVESTSMAELVASGIDDGKAVVDQWAANPNSKAALVNAALVAAGIGRSQSDDGSTWWTLDLGGADDPSCQ